MGEFPPPAHFYDKNGRGLPGGAKIFVPVIGLQAVRFVVK
jgi:hypothetical protein